MSNNFRNTELLGKLARHPLKSQLARALDVAETFQGDVEYLALNKDLSVQGRQKELQSKLRSAIRDNRDARLPLDKMKAELEVKRAAVQRPPLDRTDKVAVDDRRELRTILRGMDHPGARALLLSGAGSDPDFVDAMLEAKPIVSGLMPEEKFIVEAARQERLAGLYGPQIAEINELEGVIAEAASIFDLALTDLKLHSEMDDRTFTEFTTPILTRKNAPWLLRDGNSIVRIRPEKRGTPELHLPATPKEISDGKFYKSEAEYLADRAA